MFRRSLATALALAAALPLIPASTYAADDQLTAKQRAAAEKRAQEITRWAAEPTVVAAVKAQNQRGPLAGMDENAWRSLKRSDAVVKAFQTSPAGKLLSEKLAASHGTFVEAFLSGAAGEKVAFASKTSSYIHRGKPKFDVPFGKGVHWIGKPEFDESSQTYVVQVSVPVRDGAKAIGVLVVGVSVEAL